MMQGCSMSVSTPPKLGADRRDARTVHDARRRLSPAAHGEAHDAAEAAHLLGRDLVIRVRREPAVEHPLHRGVRPSSARHGEPGRVLPLDARSASVFIPRPISAAAWGSTMPPATPACRDQRDQRARSGDRAAEDVVVAGQVFAGAVDHEVHAAADLVELQGVANVASTIVFTRAFLQISAKRDRSIQWR